MPIVTEKCGNESVFLSLLFSGFCLVLNVQWTSVKGRCATRQNDCFSSLAFLLWAPLQLYIEKLMPPLIAKWNELKDEDKDLFPLLEVRFFFR